ncbi:MAG: hypothetical protein U0414_26375 [Polyangiaceae bacterium]
MKKLLAGTATASLALIVIACAGPPSRSSVSNEPICPDFQLGPRKTRMHGALKRPVTMTVKDGSSPVVITTLYGLNAKGARPTLFLLPDTNAEYTVEWTQCPNEKAPIEAAAWAAKEKEAAAPAQGASFQCAETKPFATTKLTTKRGDEASRTIPFPDNLPEPECWAADAPPAPEPPPPSATVSAEPPPPPPTASASAPPPEPVVVELWVDSHDVLRFGDQKIEKLEDLKPIAADALAKNKEASARVHSDKKATTKRVQSILEALKDAGIVEVVVDMDVPPPAASSSASARPSASAPPKK